MASLLFIKQTLFPLSHGCAWAADISLGGLSWHHSHHSYGGCSCLFGCLNTNWSKSTTNLPFDISFPRGLFWGFLWYMYTPEHAGIDMIHICLMFIPFISITAKLGVINSQFCRSLRHCSSKFFFITHMFVSLFLKNNDYPLNILLKMSRYLLN